MRNLQAGQNIGLGGGTARFQVSGAAPLTVSALVVAADLQVGSAADVLVSERPAGPGVRLEEEAAAITVSPGQVRADAQAVLLVASATGDTGPVTARLAEDDTPVAAFVITPQSGETALLCFELYRRGSGWKLRALGQGYAGGMAELLRAHGAQGYVAATAAAQTPVESTQPVVPAAVPMEVGHGLERLWMIFEDAARSASALESARGYAAQRLDQELSAAVADPATRNTAAADTARAAAQRRHDDLAATAERDHLRDSAQLQRELAEADAVLPASLASWTAPAWDRPSTAADGIRLGELYAPGRGALRVPYCVPVPLNRPLWLDTESSAAVAPVVGALLARLLRAAPQRRTVVDIIDLTGAFTGFTEMLAPVLAGPPVTDHTAISSRLQQLVDAAELAEMAANSGQGEAPTEHRILLAADFPHGYQHLDVQRLAALLVRGELIGLSTMIVGASESGSGDGTLAALSRACRHLPAAGNAALFDPWAGNPWQLDLDLLPQEPERRERILRAT